MPKYKPKTKPKPKPKSKGYWYGKTRTLRKHSQKTC